METDLCYYITSSPSQYLGEDSSRIIIYQLIVALRFLHSCDCSHLDIKCDNILIKLLKPRSGSITEATDGNNINDDLPFIKLADFGYSRIIREHSFRKTHVGTVSETKFIYIYMYIFFKLYFYYFYYSFREFIMLQRFIMVQVVIIV